jgi:hypothetical protein
MRQVSPGLKTKDEAFMEPGGLQTVASRGKCRERHARDVLKLADGLNGIDM